MSNNNFTLRSLRKRRMKATDVPASCETDHLYFRAGSGPRGRSHDRQSQTHVDHIIMFTRGSALAAPLAFQTTFKSRRDCLWGFSFPKLARSTSRTPPPRPPSLLLFFSRDDARDTGKHAMTPCLPIKCLPEAEATMGNNQERNPHMLYLRSCVLYLS